MLQDPQESIPVGYLMGVVRKEHFTLEWIQVLSHDLHVLFLINSLLTGNLQITELVYNRTSLTLTCTSTGRPVDSVTWRRDGVEVGSEFTQMQTITDTLTASYQHSLSSQDVANFVGNFTCEVRDVDFNIDSRTLLISGKLCQYHLYTPLECHNYV